MNTEPVRVLLAEDDEDDYLLTRQAFESISENRFQLTWRRTFGEVLETLSEGAYDICLFDHSLGERTGLELIQAAIRQGVTAPIILLTGAEGGGLDSQATGVGATDFLDKKELTPALLERAIRYALERAQTHARLVLSDRLASLGTLTAGIAHEINNPLSYVLSNLSFAIEELEGIKERLRADPAMKEVCESMHEARQGAERVARIVRDLKTLGRAGTEPLEEVDVHPVLEMAIRITTHEVSERAQVVRCFTGPLFVRANESKLGQIFVNLLLNAAQAIPKGATQKNTITVTTHLGEGDQAHVEFSDTGAGMSSEVMAQLFRPFFTTKPPGVGTGLGLSISQSLVKQFGGELRVQSELGKGSVFAVVLPRVIAPEAHTSMESS